MNAPPTHDEQDSNHARHVSPNVSIEPERDELGVLDKIDGGLAQIDDEISSTSIKESQESLFIIVIPPIIWLLHFSASYLTTAIYCSKFDDNAAVSHSVNFAIFSYTAVAITLLVIAGNRFHTRYRYDNTNPPHNHATRADRFPFLGQAGFLLSILSGVAVTYTSLVAVFVTGCH